jgi:hypothetical protein
VSFRIVRRAAYTITPLLFLSLCVTAREQNTTFIKDSKIEWRDQASQNQKKIEEVEKRIDTLERKIDLDIETIRAKVDVSANYVGIGQKQVDWWLQFLAVGLAVVAIIFTFAGVAAPIFFTRSLRKEYEVNIKGAKEAEMSARDAATAANRHAQDAGDAKRQITVAQSQTNASNPMSPNQIVELEAKIADPNCSTESRLIYKTLLEQQRLNWELAEKYAAEYVDKFPYGREAYLRLGYSQSRFAQTRGSAERKRLFEAALTNYNKELENEPQSSQTKSNIGWAYSELAALETDQNNKIAKYQLASKALSEAVILDPLNVDAWNNHGYMFLEQAKAGTDYNKRDELAKQAKKYFEKALAINPDYRIASGNLNALNALMKVSQPA